MSAARRRWTLGLFAAALAIAVGCRPTADGSSEARRYRVRGVVRQLPAGPAVPLLVEHEAIPDLLDPSGAPAPMAAMTMPFPLADEVDAAALGLEVGDVVALTLEVDWSAPSAMLVIAVERLPPDTVLVVPGNRRTDTDNGPGASTP